MSYCIPVCGLPKPKPDIRKTESSYVSGRVLPSVAATLLPRVACLVLVPVPPTDSAGTTLVVILCLPEEGVNLRPHPGHSITGDTLPDSQNIAFARDDDYFFGVLHSRAHEPWAAQDGNLA